MRSWIELACSKRVVKRALKYALVVGVILIAINHGDAIINGEVTAGRPRSSSKTPVGGGGGRGVEADSISGGEPHQYSGFG